MSSKHGGIVYDNDGNAFDWGQALCRQVYGHDWSNDPNYIRDNNLPIDKPAPIYLLEAASNWQKNGKPEWANYTNPTLSKTVPFKGE